MCTTIPRQYKRRTCKIKTKQQCMKQKNNFCITLTFRKASSTLKGLLEIITAGVNKK